MPATHQVSFHRLWLEYFLKNSPDEILKFSGERTVGFVLEAGLKVLLGPWAVFIPTNVIAGLAGRILTDTTVESLQRWRQPRVVVDPARAGVIYTLEIDHRNQLLIARTPRPIVLRDFEAQLSDMVGTPLALLDEEFIALDEALDHASLPLTVYNPATDQRAEAIDYLSQIYRLQGITPDRFSHLFDAPVQYEDSYDTVEVTVIELDDWDIGTEDWPEPQSEPDPAPDNDPLPYQDEPHDPIPEPTPPEPDESQGHGKPPPKLPVRSDPLKLKTTPIIKWLLVGSIGVMLVAIQAWDLRAIVILSGVMFILGLILFHRFLISRRGY